MKQKIWRKFLVLFMALAVMMPNVVQALDTTVMSESEEISPQEEQSSEKSELAIQENSDLNEEVKDHSSSVIEERLNKAETNDLLSEEISLSNVIVDNNEYQFFGTDGNSTAVLVRHTGFLVGNVEIPTEVLNTAANWQKPSPVTEIGDEAFLGVGLVRVGIPNTITSIGRSAFQGNQLTNLLIPNSVTSIGASAFARNSLTSVIIPDSLTRIENGVFATNSLTNVIIPDSVITIGDNAFVQNSLTSVIIPDSVITIGANAFAQNQISSLDISNKVESIGTTAFLSNNLKSVKIPDSVTRMGGQVFRRNTITSIEVNEFNAIINEGGLFLENPLQYINVTDIQNIEAIRALFTSGVLEGISERTILRSKNYEAETELEKIAKFGGTVVYSISQQYQLQSTTNRVWQEYFPEVQWIKDGNDLFGEVNPLLKLESVTPSDSGVYHAVVDTIRYSDLSLEVEDPEFVFEYSGTDGDSTATLVGYNGDGGAVVIPSEAVNSEKGWERSSEVTAIGEEVFENKGLTSVEIPNNVTSIGFNAFKQNNLTSVTIPNSITNIGTAAFASNPLKFIETSVENVETLRSILALEAIIGVSERTILRALDYEIGTEIEQVASVDQTIDFAISQQYQLRSTNNPVWDLYVPDVQWEKDGIAIEGGLHKVLHLTDIQELDSGIYKAVVDGTIFPDIQLQVIPSIDPEIPSVDPSEPDVSPEGVNPTIEGLSIRYASDIRFKAAPFSLSDQTLPLDIQENQPMVTVQDMRPRDERSGWELLVSQDSSFMNGAEIVMNPFIHQENQTNLLIEGASELILNDEPQRFAGTAMTEEPNPFGILSIGMGSGENPMTLRVPGKTGVNSYETTVHWQLVTGP